VRVVDGRFDLARARLSDALVRTLWSTPERDESWPAWSDAAGRLVFQVGAGNASEGSDLWIWQPGEVEPVPLGRTPRRDEGWPAWSPHAPELAFAFRGGARAAGVALLTFSGDRPLIASIAEATPRAWFLRPRFAPDGAALVAQHRTEHDSQIWVLARATAPRALTRDPAWFHLKASYTRDGTRVVFARRPAAGGPHDVASVDLAGGALRLHASAPAADDHSPAPSPTRDELALISDRDGSFDVLLAPLAEGPARNLTRTPEWNEGAPHWSPDGELLALTVTPRDEPAPRMRQADALEHSEVRVIDREGRLLFQAPGLMPEWMPAW
jgi:Tol biopolymer transport system component